MERGTAAELVADEFWEENDSEEIQMDVAARSALAVGTSGDSARLVARSVTYLEG